MKRLKQILLGLLLVAGIVVGYDYWKFHAMRRSALALITDVEPDCRIGSLWGWPLGQEYAVSFKQPLTTDQWDRLSKLKEYEYRSYFGIGLNYPIEESAVTEIRDRTGLRVFRGVR